VLALWTGQRQGDLLRLPWSAYDGSHIRFRQSKTGRRMTMPAGVPLRELLDGTYRRSPVILTNSYGRPWTSDGFRTSWSKACARAGVSGLMFHDLRGSAVVRLALAEATVPQIATFTGHSLKDVEAIVIVARPRPRLAIGIFAIVSTGGAATAESMQGCGHLPSSER